MSAKVKSKTVRATLTNPAVLDMFNSVVGGPGGAANVRVTWPKFCRLRAQVERFVQLLEILRDAAALAPFPGVLAALAAYAAALRAQAAAAFAAPDLGADPEAAPAADAAAFAAAYPAAVRSSVVNTAIVTCQNLVPFKRSLADPAALRDRFLTRAPVSLAPLPDLPALDFRALYADPRLAAEGRELLLAALHKLYAIGHAVYEAASAPDVDVEEFATVIMGSLDDVRKHVPRCEQAFDKIAQSVDLLKGNFDGYYRDYAASNNPTIIMENFVLDVAKTSKASPKVVAQFRTIISHYRRIVAAQSGDPRMQVLFQQVDRNFGALERRSGEGAAEDESSGDEADAAGAPPAGPAAAAAPSAGGPAGQASARDAAPAPSAAAARLPAAPKARKGKSARKARSRRAAAEKAAAAGPGLAEELDREAAELGAGPEDEAASPLAAGGGEAGAAPPPASEALLRAILGGAGEGGAMFAGPLLGEGGEARFSGAEVRFSGAEARFSGADEGGAPPDALAAGP